MTNAIEKHETAEGSVFYFNHATLLIRAYHPNGHRERWPARGYDHETKYKSFLMLTDQWDKINA